MLYIHLELLNISVKYFDKEWLVFFIHKVVCFIFFKFWSGYYLTSRWSFGPAGWLQWTWWGAWRPLQATGAGLCTLHTRLHHTSPHPQCQTENKPLHINLCQLENKIKCLCLCLKLEALHNVLVWPNYKIISFRLQMLNCRTRGGWVSYCYHFPDYFYRIYMGIY